jgi:hypothetical protein
MTDENEDAAGRANLGAARLLIGLAQGVGFLLFTEAVGARTWPTNDPLATNIIGLALVFVPPTLLVALGRLRPFTLGLWIVGTLLLITALAMHGVSRETTPFADEPGLLFVLLPPLLFIAYHLVAASDADLRVPARYPTYFEIAWKNGVQLALSLAFLGTFWLLLYLGALLFGLIQIQLFADIIGEKWFAYPVTTTVFALAVHLTDVRIGLINGIRAVALVLLSWLLPVMTALAVAFLAALPATGLVPLWATGSATAILLAAAATLVILINAAYQDGQEPPHRVLQIAARVAGLALVPFVLIAAYSLWLRIDQHGLTPERVAGAGVIAVALCYTAGYAIAALWPGRWFKPLEFTNFVSALIAFGLLVAVQTPFGDPARLSVEDQVRRLRAGLVTPEAFDYQFLRFNAARYGMDALKALARDKSSPRAQAIAERAQEVLDKGTPGAAPPAQEIPAKDLFAKIVVRPNGALPESFVTQDWSKDAVTPLTCARAASASLACVAYLIDLDGDGAPEVIVGTAQDARLNLYQLTPSGVWRYAGYFDAYQCGFDVRDLLTTGRYQLQPPQQRELEIGGKRLRLQGCAP